MPLKDWTQFSSVEPFIDSAMKPAWVFDETDKIRLAAYSLYEQIWRNFQSAFELVQRGTDTNPIYIPSAKKCIEATNRYLGVGFNYRLDGGVAATRNSVSDMIESIFRREKFKAKFGSIKRMSLVRGDSLWHITADVNKSPGRRISMYELDPSKYHPIYDPNDADHLEGVHIVESYTDPANKSKPLVRRQTYRKVENAAGVDVITSELGIFEQDGWDDRQLLMFPDYKIKPYPSPLTVPVFELPPEITSIPVYHISNQFESGMPFGTSELAGFERLLAAINQGITDEELALAFTGLGLYFTTAATPSGGWEIPPGSVVTGANGEIFEKVSGIASVQPSLDHINYLGGELKEAMGTPDIAIGNVDVAIAQSGIALALQMGPILTRNREKEDELLAVHDHMLFDLVHGWLPAYEQMDTTNISPTPSFDDPMPKDRAAIIKEITDLLGTTPPLISAEYARTQLVERLGYEFPDGMAGNILAEIESNSKAQAFDPFAERIRSELAADLGSEGIPVNGLATGAN